MGRLEDMLQVGKLDKYYDNSVTPRKKKKKDYYFAATGIMTFQNVMAEQKHVREPHRDLLMTPGMGWTGQCRLISKDRRMSPQINSFNWIINELL